MARIKLHAIMLSLCHILVNNYALSDQLDPFNSRTYVDNCCVFSFIDLHVIQVNLSNEYLSRNSVNFE